MGSRRFLILAALVVAAGTALQLPTLDIGFFVDDYVHQLVLAGHAPLGSPMQPWSLYDFGEADAWRNLEDPIWSPIWWTSPDWKIRFFRPISSLSLRIDHWFWGDSPLGYHVMSLGWYVVALVLVLSLYRSIGFEPGAALAALALWATTNCGALPVGWIANRNTLLATVATLGAVLAVIRIRGRWRIPAALVAAIVAVGCKESGVAAFVLVGGWLALEAARTDGSIRRRTLVGAAVVVAVGVLYLGVLAGAGYGTRSGFYATPWLEPGRYSMHVLTLFTAGLLRSVQPVAGSDHRRAVWPASPGGCIGRSRTRGGVSGRRSRATGRQSNLGVRPRRDQANREPPG
jgi:hypothetical protein